MGTVAVKLVVHWLRHTSLCLIILFGLSGCLFVTHTTKEERIDSELPIFQASADNFELWVRLGDKNQDLTDLELLQITLIDDDGKKLNLELIPNSRAHDFRTPPDRAKRPVHSVSWRFQMKSPSGQKIKRPDDPFTVEVIVENHGRRYRTFGKFRIDGEVHELIDYLSKNPG